ncbi:hypothetical protein RP20_CCG002394 [Aedes albopictus]|nr:hypothetical protein RP20_CCG002394 [Aedes albopictus]
MIAEATSEDDTLRMVRDYIRKGWPSKATSEDPGVQQFFARRESLYEAQKVLMYGDRVVIPKKLQQKVLHQLHKGHPGIDRMRSLA